MATRREFHGKIAGMSIVAAAARATWASNATASVHTSPTRRIRGIVQTVRDPIPASKLGFTLPHEHICASSAGFWQVWPEFLGGVYSW